LAIPHKERLATLHAICLQISLQSLFRIFPHASCVHIFRDISGKYSKIHKNAREYIQYSLRFLFHLTKNLTTHLSHNLCAVLPFSTGQENDLLSCFCFISSCENFVEMLDKYRGVCYNIKETLNKACA